MYLIVRDYKLSSFAKYYLSFCNDKITKWAFDNLENLVNSFGASIIWSLAGRIHGIQSLNEKLTLVRSQRLIDELKCCYINCCSNQDKITKQMFRELISNDFQRSDYVPLIDRRLDRIYELSDSDEEFCSIVALVNSNFEKTKRYVRVIIASCLTYIVFQLIN